MHPLFFAFNLQCHVCDVCHESTKGPHWDAYRCRTCDFDLCPRCYRRKDKPDFKGVSVRGAEDRQLTSWDYLRRVLLLCVAFRMYLIVLVATLISSQALSVAIPTIQGHVFDSIVAAARGDAGADGDFAFWIRVYLVVNLALGLVSGLRSLVSEFVIQKFSNSIRQAFFDAVIRLDIAFFDAMRVGQFSSRLSNDISGMVAPVQVLLNDFVAQGLLLAGGAFMSFYTSWRLSILALTAVPPVSVAYRRYAKWGRKINRAIWQALGDAASTAIEAVNNIRTVRGFAAESVEERKYDTAVNVAVKHGIKNASVEASVSMFSTYMNLFTGALILWYGGELVLQDNGGLTLGTLITFELYWNMMQNAFLSLAEVFNQMIAASSAAERVFSLMDVKPDVDPDAGAVLDISSVQGSLKLETVHFAYKTRPDNKVLKGVCLTIPAGQTTAMVGKSGSGKTTIVHLLLRLYEPSAGRLLLDGVPLSHYSSSSVRQHVGFVSQDTQLFAASILNNLCYGLREMPSMEKVIAATQAANAHEFILETDEGYQTKVGEKGVRLSGGQRQRLAIARCFLRDPRFLFLDEATSALDTENEALVQVGLDALVARKNSTVVLIAHRLSTVRQADQIAVVSAGQVTELGSHDELVQQGGLYATLVSRQATREANRIDESGPLVVDALFDEVVGGTIPDESGEFADVKIDVASSAAGDVDDTASTKQEQEAWPEAAVTGGIFAEDD